MPKWGLTEEQIQSEPWGLAADWLQPEKQITDPVHGDIFLNRLEVAFLDSPPLQRLRRVRQLGMTHLVYPGATHTRLSHSLGSLRAAQDLLDVVIDQRNTSHADPDLFAEWEKLGGVEYDRRVAEATVLARLGGLLHDIGHIPFGHTLEDDLRLLSAHDENGKRFDVLWAQLPDPLQEAINDRLMAALRPLILSKLKRDGGEEPAEYPFIPDIVGNTICADLLDYLPRDHLNTGLPAKFGRRFVDSFYVTPSDQQFEPQRMVMRISRNGQSRVDVVSELFKYLRYRYELSERVLVHHAKLAADAMLGKLFETWSNVIRETADPHVGASTDDSAAQEIEHELLQRGDDGILEHLASEARRPEAQGDPRWQTIESLAQALLERRLYKSIGRYSKLAMSEEIHKRFGPKPKTFGPNPERVALERDVVRYVGLDDDSAVLMWVPKPSMLLKAADVLCDDGGQIAKLASIDEHGANRGAEIYKSHRELWGVRVFVDPTIVPEFKRRIVLARVAERMGVWEWDVKVARLPELAAEHVASEMELPVGKLPDLQRIANDLHGDEPTFDELTERLKAHVPVRTEERTPAQEAWEAWGNSDHARYGYEHPQLPERIAAADRNIVEVDGERYRIDTLDGLRELNLDLHLRDLPDDFVDVPAAHGIIREAIREDVSAVYDRIRPPTGGRAMRTGTGNPDSIRAAIESTFKEIAEEHGKLDL